MRGKHPAAAPLSGILRRIAAAQPPGMDEPRSQAGNPAALKEEEARWQVANPDVEFRRCPARAVRNPGPATRTARGAGSAPMPGSPAGNNDRGTLGAPGAAAFLLNDASETMEAKA